MTSPEIRHHDGEPMPWESAFEGPISVQKTPDPRDDGFVLTYSIQSTSDEATSVVISDTFDIDHPEEIGFHPEHTPMNWDVEGNTVTMEHFVADSDVELVLGLVTDDSSSTVEDVMSRPAITEVAPADRSEGDGSGDVEDSGDTGLFERAKRSLMSSNGTEPAEPAESDDLATVEEPPEESSPNKGVESEASDPESEEEARLPREPDENQPDPVVELTFAEQLSQELTADEVDDDVLVGLREQLGQRPTRSEELRLEHMQAKLEDLSVYIRMFESFVDEYGTLPEFAEELNETLATIDDATENVRNETSAVRSDLESVQDEMASLEDRLTDTSRAFEEDIDTVRDEISTVNATLDDLESDVRDLEPTIERMDRLTDAIETTLADESSIDAT